MISNLLRFALLLLITTLSIGCDQTSTIDQSKSHRDYMDQNSNLDGNDYRAERLRAIQQGAKK